jgi:hypothetical protein
MEDIIAIRVTDSGGRKHYFLTWGRIFDRIETDELYLAIKPHLKRFGIKNKRQFHLCDSLREAMQQRYFFEGFFKMAQERIPYGVSSYPKWKSKQKARIKKGRGIYYLGVDK